MARVADQNPLGRKPNIGHARCEMSQLSRSRGQWSVCLLLRETRTSSISTTVHLLTLKKGQILCSYINGDVL